jgi:trans-2,3-dihydro-3-hydroxyanthranilate isomerase
LHAFTWLDVFTDTPMAGNGLAVVHDADGLDDAAMLAFARETQLSETSFVQSPSVQGATYRNRIWTVGRELRLAGHPSLGAAVAEARLRGEPSARYVQQTPAGLQPVDVELRSDGRTAHAEMVQEPAEFHASPDEGRVAAVCGLTEEDLHPELRPQFVATGVPQLIVPLAGREALGRASTGDPESLAGLIAEGDAVVVYMAVVEADGRGWARSFFAEGPLALEDPATGSAVGPLCAYLDHYAGISAISIAQGDEIGRPSRLDARVDGDRVRVGGDCVILMTGELSL